jgi:hypothetical protein
MIYGILAFLFIALLVFVYFQTKLFVRVIIHLTHVLSDLKAFSMGKQPELHKVVNPMVPIEPSHPDFGLGKILEEAEKAGSENREEEEVF